MAMKIVCQFRCQISVNACGDGNLGDRVAARRPSGLQDAILHQSQQHGRAPACGHRCHRAVSIFNGRSSGSNRWRYVNVPYFSRHIWNGDVPWKLGMKNRHFFYGIGTSVLNRILKIPLSIWLDDALDDFSWWSFSRWKTWKTWKTSSTQHPFLRWKMTHGACWNYVGNRFLGGLNLMSHCCQSSRTSKVVEMVVEIDPCCIPLLPLEGSIQILCPARCSSMQMERSRNTTIPQTSSALGDHCRCLSWQSSQVVTGRTMKSR